MYKTPTGHGSPAHEPPALLLYGFTFLLLPLRLHHAPAQRFGRGQASVELQLLYVLGCEDRHSDGLKVYLRCGKSSAFLLCWHSEAREAQYSNNTFARRRCCAQTSVKIPLVPGIDLTRAIIERAGNGAHSAVSARCCAC